VTAASQSAGAAAEQAAERKSLKYAELPSAYEFQPVALETHGPMGEATTSFISELGCKISEYSVNPFDSHYFFSSKSAWSFSAIIPFSSTRPSHP